MERTQSRVYCPIQNVEIRDSGAGDGSYTVRGLAAVYNQRSLDLGGFREEIAPGAFDRVLATNPHVIFDWDHDTRYTLASTENQTLELRSGPGGLEFWARVAPTSYAADLRVLLERRDISQASFMFCIGDETWSVDEDGGAVARVTEVSALFDVTVTGRGAYPQTDVSMAALHARRLEDAKASGRLPEGVAEGRDGTPETGSEGVAETGTNDGQDFEARKAALVASNARLIDLA